MLPPECIVSNIFHGSTFEKEVYNNLLDLSRVLGYKKYIQSHTLFYLIQTKQPEKAQVEGSIYTHAYKPLIFGLGKQGLIAESKIKGQVDTFDIDNTLGDTRVDEVKFHGYGLLWDDFKTESNLDERIREKLQVPEYVPLRSLSEDDMVSIF